MSGDIRDAPMATGELAMRSQPDATIIRGAARLPKLLRRRFGFRDGLPYRVEAIEDGILLRPLRSEPGRRRARKSAAQRVIEHAEDRFDRRELRRRLDDPDSRVRIPWEQVERDLEQ